MKSHARWTNNEIEVLKKYGATSLLHELTGLLPRHTSNAITCKRARLGIKLAEDYSYRQGLYSASFVDIDALCKVDQTIKLDDLDNLTLQVLLGSMLGDGSIVKIGKNKRNFVFNELHGLKQQDYAIWKSEMLSLFKPKLFGLETRPSLITASHPIMTLLRDKFYGTRDKGTNTKKCTKNIIPFDLVCKLDLFGLMIWYLDDGHCGGTPYIGNKGYKFDDLDKLVLMFNVRHNTSLYVKQYKHGHGWYKQIFVPAIDKHELFPKWVDLAREHDLPQCMWYKLKRKVSNGKQQIKSGRQIHS